MASGPAPRQRQATLPGAGASSGARTLGPVRAPRALLLALLLGAAPSAPRSARGAPEPAPEAAPRDLSSLLAPVRREAGMPALGGALVEGGRLVGVGVDGVRRRGSPEPVGLGDRWHLGSCTKAMTATLCALLVEEGRLAWDRRVLDAFPRLRGSAAAGWEGATLALLLQHRGGAPESLDADGLWGRLWSFQGTPREARQTLLRGVLARPPAHPPGGPGEYSNAGISIAGAMAEAAADRAFEELLAERLFKPLGMRSAGFGAPGVAGRLDEPRGHRADGAPVEPGPGADNPPAITPAGRVHATLADWARFVALHLEGARGRPRLLGAASFARLHARAAPDDDFAMGWIVAERPWANGRVLTHEGSNTMWTCVVWLAPERDFAVLVTCNQGGDGAHQACDRACAALIRDQISRR